MDSQIPQAGHSLALTELGRNGNHSDFQRKTGYACYVSTQGGARNLHY
jgi:hypothetical protein